MMLQAVPFQCSTRVRPCTVVPTTVATLPTAQMSLGDRAESPLNWLLAAPAGGGVSALAARPGGGRAEGDHAVEGRLGAPGEGGRGHDGPGAAVPVRGQR